MLAGVVHIRVSEHNASKDFYISEVLLDERAPYFAEVCGERDDQDTIVDIADVHIETFTIFITWLNNKSNDSVFGPLHRNPISGFYWTAGMPLIKLYIFACEYEISQLGEDALRRFTSLIYHAGGKETTPRSFAVDIEAIPTIEEVNYVYENTASDDPLRPILVDAFCAANMDVNFSLMGADSEFLVDVIMQMRKNQNVWQGVLGFRSLEFSEGIEHMEDVEHVEGGCKKRKRGCVAPEVFP